MIKWLAKLFMMMRWSEPPFCSPTYISYKICLLAKSHQGIMYPHVVRPDHHILSYQAPPSLRKLLSVVYDSRCWNRPEWVKMDHHDFGKVTARVKASSPSAAIGTMIGKDSRNQSKSGEFLCIGNGLGSLIGFQMLLYVNNIIHVIG